MKEMICFDIDGTLRNPMSHMVCESTLKALKLLKENGYRIVVATGRGKDSLMKTGIMEIADWDGYVCNNGQVVLNKDRETIFHATMDKDAVRKVLEIANKNNMVACIKSKIRKINKEVDEYALTSLNFFGNPIPMVGEYEGEDVDAMIVYGPLKYSYDEYRGIKGVNVLPGESTYADLTIEGISKASGIKQLMNIYQLNEYIAFGDSLNDYDMFSEASISVAMGQGNEILKQKATYVTSSIDEDGIYNACIKLGLIGENNG
jgi:Cof subfamily protein (haloacid dehalogenase superfamily)